MSFSYFHVTLTSVRQVRMFFRQMKRNVPGPRFVMITISTRQKSASPHPHHFSSGGEFSMYSRWKSNLFAMKAIYRKIRALFNWPSVIKVPYVASILGKNRLFQKAKKRWGWRGLAREIFRPKRFENQRSCETSPQSLAMRNAVNNTAAVLGGGEWERWRKGWKTTRWWFQIFFIFTPTWGRFPIWLIFFKGVETTNQTKFVGRGPPPLTLESLCTTLTACSWSNSGHWWWEPLSTINLFQQQIAAGKFLWCNVIPWQEDIFSST